MPHCLTKRVNETDKRGHACPGSLCFSGCRPFELQAGLGESGRVLARTLPRASARGGSPLATAPHSIAERFRDLAAATTSPPTFSLDLPRTRATIGSVHESTHLPVVPYLFSSGGCFHGPNC